MQFSTLLGNLFAAMTELLLTSETIKIRIKQKKCM